MLKNKGKLKKGSLRIKITTPPVFTIKNQNFICIYMSQITITKKKRTGI